MDDRKKRAARQRFEVFEGGGKRFSFSNFKRTFIFYLLLLLALAVVVQLGYHWLGEQFLSWRLQVFEAEKAQMLKEVYAAGLVTRHEELISASQNVVVLKLAPDGQRVAAGEELARLGLFNPADWPSDEEEAAGAEERSGSFFEEAKNYWHNLIGNGEVEEEPLSETEAEPHSGPAENEKEAEQIPQSAGQEEEALAGGLSAAELSVDALSVFAGRPGFVSHYCDGLEGCAGACYPAEIKQQLQETNSNEAGETEEEDQEPGLVRKEGDRVYAGEPLLKLVDNWHWYFSAVLPLHEGRPLTQLKTVALIFDFASSASVTGELFHFETDEAKQKVYLTYIVDKQLPGFDRARLTGAFIQYGQHWGIVVPARAVFEKEGQSGVYINSGGRVVFKAVTVTEKQEERLMVEGIEPHTLVIARPDLVEEGQRFR